MWKPNIVVSSIIILFSLSFICISNGETTPSCPPLEDLNNNSVIGILSHPRKYNGSYIPASYVKFAEAGGARVIPLIYAEPWSVLSSKLELVNGVILTGGVRKYSSYLSVITKILQVHILHAYIFTCQSKVKEKNDGGEHFPLYAINLGFELLIELVSKNNDVLESVDAQKLTTKLQFEDVPVRGIVLGSFPLYLRNKLKSDCLVSLNNKYGITRERFLSDKELSGFFKAITTSKDKNNKDFVTTIQAYDYPIVGFQWNPQKNAFEWGSPEIPHSLYAIQVTQYAANYLVSEARKSRNEPPTEQILDNLIYKYNTYYSGANGKGFDETYYFDAYESTTSIKALAEE
ncbi:gamma-glutamyl hydrolase 1-like [Chenopodium quinoa]|uniref:gamma-glutamyl hydrolase 1-like n=1 Tax=Chenopodium quinoa TaxID=63459 RepID=UPI000B7909AD|nr:gamma-glutamyl hydrolase 1-like [Chenopodium quinoa]